MGKAAKRAEVRWSVRRALWPMLAGLAGLARLARLAVRARVCGGCSVYTISETGPSVRTGDPRGVGPAAGAQTECGDGASLSATPRPRGVRTGTGTLVRRAGAHGGRSASNGRHDVARQSWRGNPWGYVVAALAHQTCVVLAEAETVGKGHALAGGRRCSRRCSLGTCAGGVVTGAAWLASRCLRSTPQRDPPRGGRNVPRRYDG
jgi:hypothetical protein